MGKLSKEKDNTIRQDPVNRETINQAQAMNVIILPE